MKTKFWKTLKCIGIGAGIFGIILALFLFMGVVSSVQIKDMSDDEKLAYAKGQYDAMNGDIRIEQVDSITYKQSKCFLDTDDKFIPKIFVVSEK